MSDTKPPQKDESTNSVLEKSKKKSVVDLGKFSDASSIPIGGNVVVTDLNKTARVLTEFANSPSILAAGEALKQTQELTLKLNNFGTVQTLNKLSELGAAVVEPLKNLESKLNALNELNKISVGSETLEAIRRFRYEKNLLDVYDPSPRYPKSEITMLMLKESLQDLKTEITNKVVVEMRAHFDKMAGKSIIDTEFKDQILYCSKCKEYVVKVKNALLYILSLRMQKCPNCDKKLEQPGDFIIKDV